VMKSKLQVRCLWDAVDLDDTVVPLHKDMPSSVRCHPE
jgi:hypothetical protein